MTKFNDVGNSFYHEIRTSIFPTIYVMHFKAHGCRYFKPLT
jgi:hypothetical protein